MDKNQILIGTLKKGKPPEIIFVDDTHIILPEFDKKIPFADIAEIDGARHIALVRLNIPGVEGMTHAGTLRILTKTNVEFVVEVDNPKEVAAMLKGYILAKGQGTKK